MNPMIQGYRYSAMWWRLCGGIAQANLHVLQQISKTGVAQARRSAVPMVAYGIYAAKSIKAEDAGTDSTSALDRARRNVGKTGGGGQSFTAHRATRARTVPSQADQFPAVAREIEANAV